MSALQRPAGKDSGEEGNLRGLPWAGHEPRGSIRRRCVAVVVVASPPAVASQVPGVEREPHRACTDQPVLGVSGVSPCRESAIRHSGIVRCCPQTQRVGGRAAMRSPRSAIVAGMPTLTFAAPSTATCKQAPVNATHCDVVSVCGHFTPTAMLYQTMQTDGGYLVAKLLRQSEGLMLECCIHNVGIKHPKKLGLSTYADISYPKTLWI